MKSVVKTYLKATTYLQQWLPEPLKVLFLYPLVPSNKQTKQEIPQKKENKTQKKPLHVCIHELCELHTILNQTITLFILGAYVNEGCVIDLSAACIVTSPISPSFFSLFLAHSIHSVLPILSILVMYASEEWSPWLVNPLTPKGKQSTSSQESSLQAHFWWEHFQSLLFSYPQFACDLESNNLFIYFQHESLSVTKLQSCTQSSFQLSK